LLNPFFGDSHVKIFTEVALFLAENNYNVSMYMLENAPYKDKLIDAGVTPVYYYGMDDSERQHVLELVRTN